MVLQFRAGDLVTLAMIYARTGRDNQLEALRELVALGGFSGVRLHPLRDLVRCLGLHLLSPSLAQAEAWESLTAEGVAEFPHIVAFLDGAQALPGILERAWPITSRLQVSAVPQRSCADGELALIFQGLEALPLGNVDKAAWSAAWKKLQDKLGTGGCAEEKGHATLRACFCRTAEGLQGSRSRRSYLSKIPGDLFGDWQSEARSLKERGGQSLSPAVTAARAYLCELDTRWQSAREEAGVTMKKHVIVRAEWGQPR
ncbi:unnamed protein product [Effrenium voratum]|nr:unnamed protein product [Effrenium voratum]